MPLNRTDSSDDERRQRRRLPAKTCLILGGLQVAVGMLSFSINVASLLQHSDITKTGYGIWGGLLVSRETQ